MTQAPDRPAFPLDNTDPALLQRLPETLAEMQGRCPVAWSDASGGFWALTKYDDVVTASNDWQTYTVTKGIMIPPTGASMPVIPAELDPPRHTSLRKLVLADFTDKALQRWRPGLEKIVDDAFAPLLPAGRADLVRDIAHPVPVLAISLILGHRLGLAARARAGRQLHPGHRAAGAGPAAGARSWRRSSRRRSTPGAAGRSPTCSAPTSTPRSTASRSHRRSCSGSCS